MTARCRLLLAMALAFGMAAEAEDVMNFQVKGSNPGGVGGYTGEVTLSKLSKTTAKVHWTAGAKKQVTEGFAIKTANAIGTAYGPGLYALAVYEMQGKRIHATWALATKPEESGAYELKGSEYQGSLSFSDGTPGTVTFTARKNGLYKVVWDLQSGKYEGIGVRAGDVLVAASGDAATGFGIGAYTPKGDDIVGLWATTQTDAPGGETWSQAGGVATGAADGKSVLFGGESYALAESKSVPGKTSSEWRKYLREGEDLANFRKRVTLQTLNIKATAGEFAKAKLEQIRQDNPGSYGQEVDVKEDAATILYILVNGESVELNLHRYQKAASGLVSAQFVMRNKPPYDTQKKFKAEQDKEWDKWLQDLGTLTGNAEAIIAATQASSEPAVAPVAAKGEDNAELAKAIKADMDKCVALARKFMEHIQAGETEQAIALMSDSAFAKTSRESFVKSVEKSNGVFGALKDYKPDKSATDFGIKDGVMTFTLQADAEYANGKVRETLKFIRNDQGAIEFVGYNRTAKE